MAQERSRSAPPTRRSARSSTTKAIQALADGVGSGGGRLVAGGLPVQLAPFRAAAAEAGAAATATALSTVLLWSGATALALTLVTAVLMIRRPRADADVATSVTH